MEVFLDTSFIISCIRKRIDFIEQLKALGFRILIPLEVFQEMKDLKRKQGTSHNDKVSIDLAFEMLEDKGIKKTRLGGKGVDYGLIQKGKSGVYIATLDRAIKREVPRRVVIFSAKNSVGIEED